MRFQFSMVQLAAGLGVLIGSGLAQAGGGTLDPLPPGTPPVHSQGPSCGATIDGTNLHEACFVQALPQTLTCSGPSPEYQGPSSVYGSLNGKTDSLTLRQYIIKQNEGSDCQCANAGKQFTALTVSLVTAIPAPAGVFYGVVSSLSELATLDLSAPTLEFHSLATTGGTSFNVNQLKIQGNAATIDVDASTAGSAVSKNFTRQLTCQ